MAAILITPKASSSPGIIEKRLRIHFLLSSILCPGTFLKVDRLRSLRSVTLAKVHAYAEKFKLAHSVEAFFYGNLTLEQADAMSSKLVEARKAFLESASKARAVKMPEHLAHLEEWFLKDPAERIVVLEAAFNEHFERQKAAKKEMEEMKKKMSLPAHVRGPNPNGRRR